MLEYTAEYNLTMLFSQILVAQYLETLYSKTQAKDATQQIVRYYIFLVPVPQLTYLSDKFSDKQISCGRSVKISN